MVGRDGKETMTNTHIDHRERTDSLESECLHQQPSEGVGERRKMEWYISVIRQAVCVCCVCE